MFERLLSNQAVVFLGSIQCSRSILENGEPAANTNAVIAVPFLLREDLVK